MFGMGVVSWIVRVTSRVLYDGAADGLGSREVADVVREAGWGNVEERLKCGLWNEKIMLHLRALYTTLPAVRGRAPPVSSLQTDSRLSSIMQPRLAPGTQTVSATDLPSPDSPIVDQPQQSAPISASAMRSTGLPPLYTGRHPAARITRGWEAGDPAIISVMALVAVGGAA
ncbi:hypothetical protein C8Q77DRAFT_21893 [Trametes polyzona]|nr:hypothetical protein C8Q77DRAFT_21893 [Trametes polyzona]